MEELKKLVSIIIPCYNQAIFLEDTLNSVLSQTYKNWECIIVNDGSTDNTKNISMIWLEKDSRFIYIEKPNGGLSSARNAGLETAKGDYIQFLDADDYLHSDKLKASLDLFYKHAIDIAISDFNLFFSLDKLLPPYCSLNLKLFTFNAILYKWDSGFSIPIHCGVFKSSLFSNFRFPEHLKAKEDWIMWVSLFNDKKCKTMFIDKSLAFYRRNSTSMTFKGSMQSEYLLAIKYLKTILKDDDYDKLTLELISRYFNDADLLKRRIKGVKQSNTYQTGLMIKKGLRVMGLLKISKKLFPYFLKLKTKD